METFANIIWIAFQVGTVCLLIASLLLGKRCPVEEEDDA